MKKFLTILPFLAALLLASPPAHAGGFPAPVKHLSRLVGHWKGTGTMTEGGKVHAVTIDMQCEPEGGGWGVSCKSTMKGMPGVDTFRETDLLGFDPGTRVTHWFAVSNAGVAEDFSGSWTTDNTLQVAYHGKMQGKAFEERITVSLDGSHRVTFHTETSLGGKTVSVFKGTFSRR